MLIMGRAVAGIGAAGLFSGALVIVSHTIPLRQRPSKFCYTQQSMLMALMHEKSTQALLPRCSASQTYLGLYLVVYLLSI